MTPDEIFNIAYSFDRKSEGGFYNDPNAGPTNFGILQSTFTTWLAGKGLPSEDVRSITNEQVQEINYETFWIAPHLDMIAAFAPATASAVYDAGENEGYGRKPNRDNPAQMLQRRIGVSIDGVIGPGTCSKLHSAINSAGGDLSFSAIYNKERLAWIHMHSPPSVQQGLINRVNNLDAFLESHFGEGEEIPAQAPNVA